jgi:hypothetical protein
MADTVEKLIYQALATAAAAVVLPAGWSIILPGQTFTPTASSKFVSVEIHFNRSIETDLSLEMDPIRQGFMRANVMLPKGSAVVDGYNIAGTIRAAFRRGRPHLYRDPVEVRIDEDPELVNLMTGDTHHTIPVTIRWRSYYQPA